MAPGLPVAQSCQSAAADAGHSQHRTYRLGFWLLPPPVHAARLPTKNCGIGLSVDWRAQTRSSHRISLSTLPDGVLPNLGTPTIDAGVQPLQLGQAAGPASAAGRPPNTGYNIRQDYARLHGAMDPGQDPTGRPGHAACVAPGSHSVAPGVSWQCRGPDGGHWAQGTGAGTAAPWPGK